MIALNFISCLLYLVFFAILWPAFHQLRRQRTEWLEGQDSSQCRILGEKILRKAQEEGIKAILIHGVTEVPLPPVPDKDFDIDKWSQELASQKRSSAAVEFISCNGEQRTVMAIPDSLQLPLLARLQRHHKDTLDSEGQPLPPRRFTLGRRDQDILLRIDLENPS